MSVMQKGFQMIRNLNVFRGLCSGEVGHSHDGRGSLDHCLGIKKSDL